MAPVAFALETKLMQATYPQAPAFGVPVADRGHAGQGRPNGRRHAVIPKSVRSQVLRGVLKKSWPGPGVRVMWLG